MGTWIGLLLLHGLYWGLGAAILRRCFPQTRLLSCRRPHWFAAYFLGLVPNVVAAFAINQFLGLRITLVMLVVLALSLLVPTALFMIRKTSSSPGDFSENTPWSWREFFLCCIVVAVWARRHTLNPLSNWDAFMYHLPFGQMVRDGQFPSDIGRSYIMQFEAAYPPLFYFQYGLNAFIETPDLTYLAPQAMVAVTNGLICAATYYFARHQLKASAVWALVSALIVALVLNTEPNVQSVTTLYVTLAMVYSWDVFWKQNGRQPARWCSCLVAAFFWSGCYWCSYLGLPVIGWFFLGLTAAGAWSSLRGGGQRIDWTRVALASGVITLFIGPHLLRNWLVIENPLYPAFLTLLGGSDITDWFLAHRPPAATPIDADWKLLLRKSVFVGTPMVQIILAGATAVLLRIPLLETRRVHLFVMLMGFLATLFHLFHLHNTPWARYLYPVMPLASAVVATHFFALCSRPAFQVVAGSAYLWGFCFLIIYNLWFRADLLVACLVLVMFAPPIADLWMQRLGRSHDPSRGAPHGLLRYVGGVYLSFLTLILIVIIGRSFYQSFTPYWFVFVGGGLILITVTAGFSGFSRTVGRRTGAAAIGLVGIAVFAVHADWKDCNTYELPIDHDVKWMNEHLSQDDAVLLFDGRVALHLKREYLALDDVRLEPFDKATTPREAMKELEHVGITHFYFSQESSNLLSDSIRGKLALLNPAIDNESVQILYQSDTGWVTRLRHDRWSRP